MPWINPTKFGLHLLYFWGSLAELACHSEASQASVPAPLQAVVAAQASVGPTPRIHIYQTQHQGRRVYRVHQALAADAGVTTWYDSLGSKLCEGYSTSAFFESDCTNGLDDLEFGNLIYFR